jgi:putative transposase
MSRAKTPSFITELPLIVGTAEQAELMSRFQAGRQLYNAVLTEAIIRMKLVQKSELFASAKKQQKGKSRTDAFNLANTAYRYSDFELQSYANNVAKDSIWMAEKVDAQSQQTLATRAFKASQRVMFGVARKVRFKVSSRFKSMEGKTNKQGIRWKDNQLVWGKLKLSAIIDESNPVIRHGLSSKIKYVRILRKEFNGKPYWFAQLICAGVPYQKPKNFVQPGLIGIDLNVSNIAYVADHQAGLLPFAEGVPSFERKIKAAQRQMQRSQRLANPDSFEPDFTGRKGRKTVTKKGKCKKGKRMAIKTKHYLKVAAKKRELERRKVAYAQSKNRELVNDILRCGNQIKAENVSVKGWQKRYGKAIAAKSPGFFQCELARKAESAGGSFTKFSTQKTALSQTHLNGSRIKKSLSERVHYDLTGVVTHRDLFSAFLARHIIDGQLSWQDAQLEYPGMEQSLLGAWQRFDPKSANRVCHAESRLSQSPVEQIPSAHFDILSQIGGLRPDRKASPCRMESPSF